MGTRRNVGISSLNRTAQSQADFSLLSESLLKEQSDTLATQLVQFQSTIAQFSTQHHKKIKSSPVFRDHFSTLCRELGVDPLGNGQKGIWDKLGLGDWYHALAVQIIQVCLVARERNGGLMTLKEVIEGVHDLRDPKRIGGEATKVTENDLRRALETLSPLEAGYEIIVIASQTLLRCTPGQLASDSSVIVQAAEKRGRITRDQLKEFTRGAGGKEGWTRDRVERGLDNAVMVDGLLWIDEQDGKVEYWVPALFDFGR